MFDLTGRVALVTGAGRGVGEGIARALAEQGASLGVNDLVAERCERVAADLREAGRRAVASAFDVTDLDAVSRGVERLASELGPVDVLVNNAGVPPRMEFAKFRETDPGEWRKYVDLNLYGVLHCTRAVIDGMCERGFGRIVTISSGAGQAGLDLGISLYAAGKGGGISFMRHLAMEVARYGVTANTLSLGMIDNHLDPSVTTGLAKRIPVGRLGRPEDVAPAVVWLASDEGSWVTGQTIGVNGGSLTS